MKGWRTIAGSAVMLSLCVPACSYPQQRWKEFTKEVQRTAAQPKTPEEACQRRGGVMYSGQCYAPSANPSAVDAETCRMRGGLYVEEKCLVASQSTTASSHEK